MKLNLLRGKYTFQVRKHGMMEFFRCCLELDLTNGVGFAKKIDVASRADKVNQFSPGENQEFFHF